MPELPEIETSKSVVEPQIHGLTIENVLVNCQRSLHIRQ